MSKIGLTPQQENNLKIFLSRAQLSGAEVEAFNELVHALFAQDALPEAEKKQGDQEK